MKLENWNKLNGQMFSVMGIEFQFEKAEQNADGRYTIWLNEEISKSAHSLMRVDLYITDMQVDIKTFFSVFSTPPYHTTKKVTKDHIKDPSVFILTIGMMMMEDQNVRAVLNHLVGIRSGANLGIASITMNSGTVVTHSYAPYVPMTITPVTGLNGSSGNNLW